MEIANQRVIRHLNAPGIGFIGGALDAGVRLVGNAGAVPVRRGGIVERGNVAIVAASSAYTGKDGMISALVWEIAHRFINVHIQL